MKTPEQERLETKLTLLEQRGFNWIIQDIDRMLVNNTTFSIEDIIKYLKNEYKEELEKFEPKSKFIQKRLL